MRVGGRPTIAVIDNDHVPAALLIGAVVKFVNVAIAQTAILNVIVAGAERSDGDHVAVRGREYRNADLLGEEIRQREVDAVVAVVGISIRVGAPAKSSVCVWLSLPSFGAGSRST